MAHPARMVDAGEGYKPMTKPEISVIVPVYKGVRFLREALDSVRAQTFADWECLCVDDGSRDG